MDSRREEIPLPVSDPTAAERSTGTVGFRRGCDRIVSAALPPLGPATRGHAWRTRRPNDAATGTVRENSEVVKTVRGND